MSHDGITVNGKSIVGMMMLAAGKGSVLELMATGNGASQMLDELAYGDNADPRMLAERDTWRAKIADAKRAGEDWAKDKRG